VVSIDERSVGCGLAARPDQIERTFTYDALYRLTAADGGREHATPPDLPWVDAPRSRDLARARGYGERYRYDVAGNLEELRHLSADGYTRVYRLEGNRVARMEVGALAVDYRYDDAGNLLSEGTSRHYVWDHASRLREFREQGGGDEAPRVVRYLYGADGLRVRRSIEKGRRREGTISIDGLFERHLKDGAAHDVVHVLDGTLPAARLRIGAPFPGDRSPVLVFPLPDHQGNHQISLDGRGELFDREDHTPYGETTFGSYAGKERRYTGRERDRESGLAYHGARYYAPWLCRWISPDPDGPLDGLNLYGYVSQNPVNWIDPAGRRRVLIGRVYIIEGELRGQLVTYVGSTVQALRERFANHKWRELIDGAKTKVWQRQARAEMGTSPEEPIPRRAANRALRSVEQSVIKGVDRDRLRNKRNAATPDNAMAWKAQYRVKLGPRTLVRGFGGVLSVIPDIGTVRELADAFAGRVKVYGPAYVLEDEAGAFVLKVREGIFSDDYYKEYVTGPQSGKTFELSRKAYEALLRAAEALWGKFEGDKWIPGVLRPQPPPMLPQGVIHV
jgi:RHS repeat-associated protein